MLIHSRREIPEAAYYVLGNDKFFSGWGLSEGKVNVAIVPCDNYTKALEVFFNFKARPEMARVRIVIHKPRLRWWYTYSLLDSW